MRGGQRGFPPLFGGVRVIRLHGKKIETGTVMMNRCDYVDPALAWTGVKDTGIGFALSELAINIFTKPKSYLLMT